MGGGALAELLVADLSVVGMGTGWDWAKLMIKYLWTGGHSMRRGARAELAEHIARFDT